MKDQFDTSGVFETTVFEIAQVACIWLGYTPQINFCHFFLQFELSYFLDIFTS